MPTKPPIGTRLIRGHPLAQGLVGCWLLNEGNGTTVYDVSGYENHGTMTSMDPNTDWVAGPDGWALEFDGIDDYVSIPSLVLGTMSRTYTVTTVLHSTAPTGYQTNWLSSGQDGAELSIGMWNAKLAATAWSGSYDRQIPGSPTLSVGYTYTYAMTYDAATRLSKFYIDGTYLSAGDITFLIDTLAYGVRLGSRLGYTKLYGQILRACVYNRALSAADVASLSSDPYQMFESASGIRKYWYLPVGGHPAGATHYLTITSDHDRVAANMPDSGSTFAADLVIDEANAINWEGGAQTFVSGLGANAWDLRVFSGDGSVEIPFGIKQFSRVEGARKLILGLGIKSSAPLSSTSDTTYRLYRGCTGGPFENRTAVVPTEDSWISSWQMSDGSGTTLSDWTTNAYNGTLVNMDSPSGWVASTLGGMALQFDGGNDVVRVGNQSAFQLQQWTYEALVRCTDLTTVLNKLVFGTYDKDDGPGNYAGSTVNVGDGTGTYNATPRGFCKTTTHNQLKAIGYDVTLNQWHHLAFTRDVSGNEVVYIDGVARASNSFAGTVDYTNAYTAIGNIYASLNNGMKGQIGPCVISGVPRSTNWVLTAANNQLTNSTFWTIGDESVVGPSETHLRHQNGRIEITVADTLAQSLSGY